MSTLLFGSDPEFFAGYNKDGKIYVLPPAFFRETLQVPFTPDGRHPIFLDAKKELGVIVMEDGVAFEETVTPSTDWKELFERINIGKKLLSEMILSKFPNHCDSEVYTLPTINYDVDRWSKQSKQFQHCLVFGCDKDWDADNHNAPGKVVDALKHPLRYGGGHIHVSGCAKIKEEPILAIQSLKFTAGLAAVAFSDTSDLDRERTYLYGKPAKYRPQNYGKLWNDIPDTDFGVEYRTPSNRWTHSFEHAENVFNWLQIGIRNLLEGGLITELIEKVNDEVKDAIINCNQPKAKELLAYVESRI